jgi:hypothetical protein
LPAAWTTSHGKARHRQAKGSAPIFDRADPGHTRSTNTATRAANPRRHMLIHRPHGQNLRQQGARRKRSRHLSANCRDHIKKLKALGYIDNAKPLHRAQRSKSRRVIYTPRKMTEDAIRSSLSAAEQMELAEQEAQIIARERAKAKPNANAEQGREALKGEFVMLCEQYFRDARAAGWWISDIQARRAALALAEQAAGCVRLDRNAAEAPSQALGYLDDPDSETGL